MQQDKIFKRGWMVIGSAVVGTIMCLMMIGVFIYTIYVYINSGERKQSLLPIYNSPKTTELRNICGRIANRLFFGSFFSPEKKEHVSPVLTP